MCEMGIQLRAERGTSPPIFSAWILWPNGRPSQLLSSCETWHTLGHRGRNLVHTFWATVCKTVRPMLSNRCVSVCPVCNVGVLYVDKRLQWMDQDETWHAGRPRQWPHCVKSGRSFSSPKGTQPPIFGRQLFRPNSYRWIRPK